MILPVDVPVELGRDAAQRLAEQELAAPAYRAAQPSIVARALSWLAERLAELLARASDAAPGGALGLFVLLALAGLGVLLVRRQLGPLARRAAASEPGGLFAGGPRTAQEHRAAADAARAAGDLTTAVVERFRALVRGLAERNLLEVGVASTADEVTADAMSVLPDHALGLARAASLFDAVRFGGRAVSVADVDELDALEAAVRVARPATPSRPQRSVPAVPR